MLPATRSHPSTSGWTTSTWSAASTSRRSSSTCPPRTSSTLCSIGRAHARHPDGACGGPHRRRTGSPRWPRAEYRTSTRPRPLPGRLRAGGADVSVGAGDGTPRRHTGSAAPGSGVAGARRRRCPSRAGGLAVGSRHPRRCCASCRHGPPTSPRRSVTHWAGGSVPDGQPVRRSATPRCRVPWPRPLRAVGPRPSPRAVAAARP